MRVRKDAEVVQRRINIHVVSVEMGKEREQKRAKENKEVEEGDIGSQQSQGTSTKNDVRDGI